MMRYISTFSGIEAASVAWDPLGWEPVAFSEVDDFPSAVLSERFQNVPNLGDITKVDWSPYRGAVDIVVGGSPCQSFSIAGSRTGLDGASGLMWEYVRCVRDVRPEWFVWENVPGALSSTHGEDFGCLLRSMDELGYGLAWRVLDAQFFGVAQRRRRVFLVGHLGDRRAADVLFESESLLWDSPSSREKREALASDAEGGAGAAGFIYHQGSDSGNIGFEPEQSPTLTTAKPPATCYGIRPEQTPKVGEDVQPTLRAHASGGFDDCVAYTMQVRCGKPGGGKGALVQNDVSATLSTSNIQTLFQPVAMAANQRGEVRLDGGDGDTVDAIPASRSGKQVQAVVCMTDTQPNTSVDEELCGTLSAHSRKDPPVVPFAVDCRNLRESEEVSGTLQAKSNGGYSLNYTNPVRTNKSGVPYVVRKLTPLECERLQGFPDGWTDVPFKGKPAPDTRRYRALGNSMAVPVMCWIGKRISSVEEELEC